LKYQIRGCFPPGDMIFEDKNKAIEYQKMLRKKGYKIDKKIYIFREEKI